LELFVADILAFIEASFVIATLLVIHWLRNYIGKYALYLCIGGLFVFSQILSASELNLIKWGFDSSYHFSSSIFFIPLLGAIMVVYITEGTLAMQRVIVGIVICFFMFLYISYITHFQQILGGFMFFKGGSALFLEMLFVQSTKFMTGTVVALIADLFILPIVFQKLRNLKINFFYSVLGALLLATVVDTFISVSIVFWNDPGWIEQIRMSYLKKGIIVFLVSFLVGFYLKKIEKETHIEGKGAFDIVLSFFGRYGLARTLQKDITEWEGRYRLIIENASDMIFIVNREGRILDANPATIDMLKASRIKGRQFPSIVDEFSAAPCLWVQLWSEADRLSNASNESVFVANKPLRLKVDDNQKLEADAAFSRGYIHHMPVMIIVCRNMTEQNRLKKEKEELSSQLYHAQRIESIGRLAGGVAHEFNNIIHAIQGHLELMLLFDKIQDKEVEGHLQTIENLTERAGVITSQLLGFARKSKRIEDKIELGLVLRGIEDMFIPMTKKCVEVKYRKPEYNCFVKGDFVQLQQVFLNILINALDAFQIVKRDKKIIEIILQKAVKLPDEFKTASLDMKASDYFEVSINDNGVGMNENTMKRIFEPFYTTKEVGKGTGMGLAMVYGEVTAHHGFVHVTSKLGEGTTFFIYLPVSNI